MYNFTLYLQLPMKHYFKIVAKYFNSAAETEAKKARAENMKMSEILPYWIKRYELTGEEEMSKQTEQERLEIQNQLE